MGNKVNGQLYIVSFHLPLFQSLFSLSHIFACFILAHRPIDLLLLIYHLSWNRKQPRKGILAQRINYIPTGVLRKEQAPGAATIQIVWDELCFVWSPSSISNDIDKEEASTTNRYQKIKTSAKPRLSTFGYASAIRSLDIHLISTLAEKTSAIPLFTKQQPKKQSTIPIHQSRCNSPLHDSWLWPSHSFQWFLPGQYPAQMYVFLFHLFGAFLTANQKIRDLVLRGELDPSACCSYGVCKGDVNIQGA